MQRRTHTDRRRGAWLAAALVMAGVGLLALGAAISSDDPTTTSAERGPDESLAATLASLTVVSDHGRGSATGVVLDGDGHVAVRAAALAGATEVWASCSGRQPERVEVVARDPASGVAILDMADGRGSPAIPTSSTVGGDEVLLATAGRGESRPTIRTGTLDARGRWFVDTLTPNQAVRLLGVEASPADAGGGTRTGASTHDVADGSLTDAAAFDRRGRFVGLVMRSGSGRVALLPADTVVAVASRLVG